MIKYDNESRAILEKNYEINVKLGSGSFAVVYKATHKTTKKVVAVKSISLKSMSARTLSYLESEISILKKVNHPYIIGLDDYIRTDDYVYLIMEYCSLGELQDYIRNDKYQAKGMPEHVVLHFLDQMASALKYLYSHNFVHRDIKPQNILLVQSPSGSVDSLPDIRIADFGFAKFLPKTSMTNSVCGSPLYMAPEVYKKEKYDAKADIWSIGIVLYELMTGKPFFKANNHIELASMFNTYNDHVPFDDGLFSFSNELKDIIRTCLRKNPGQRASVEEFTYHVHLLVANYKQGKKSQDDDDDDFIVVDSNNNNAATSTSVTLQDDDDLLYFTTACSFREMSIAADKKRIGAMSKALSMASLAKMFGTAHDISPSASSSNSSTRSNNTDESPTLLEKDPRSTRLLIDNTARESLIKMAKSVSIYADIKYLQSELVKDDKKAAKQAKMLIQKVNSILTIAQEYGHSPIISSQLQQNKKKTTRLNEKCIGYQNEDFTIENLLYERAIELSKAAAIKQLIHEELEQCKNEFQQSIHLLEAINISRTIKEKDKRIIEKLIESIHTRFEAVCTTLRQQQK